MLVTHPSQNVATRQASLTGRRRGRFHEFGQSFLLVVLGVVGMRNAIAFYSPFSLVVLRHAQLSTTAGIGGSTKWAAQNQATHTLFVEMWGSRLPDVLRPPERANPKLHLPCVIHCLENFVLGHICADRIPFGRGPFYPRLVLPIATAAGFVSSAPV